MGPSDTRSRLDRLIDEGSHFTYDNFAYKSEYGYPKAYTAAFVAWQTRARSIIQRVFSDGDHPSRVLEEALEVEVIGNGEDKFSLMMGQILGALQAAVDILEHDSSPPHPSTKTKAISERPGTSRIFVVHGHDDRSKAELEVILSDLGLDPVVLHRQPDEGRTIIEKFEHHSDVGYAVVILTPDDVAYSATEDVLADGARSKEWRARQNVVFELGFFIGSLGRGRVCCLYKAPVSLPSDVQGVVYKRFDKAVEEVAYSLAKELRAAGYAVNL